MASLTRASIITRKTIRYGLYGLIAIILLRGSILTAIKIYRHFYPEPPPVPTIAFGRLNKLPFPENNAPKDFKYKLETPTGVLPEFSYQAKVFFMPKPSSQLLSLDMAKIKAENLGFNPSDNKVTETVYSFNHKTVPVELKISIVTGIFSMSYNLVSDPTPLEYRPPTPEIATSRARSFLSSAGLLPEDLTGPTYSEPVRLENDKIIGALSLSEGNFVRVNFFRKDYDNLPSLTSEPNKGNVWFIMGGNPQKEKQVIASEYHYFPVDENQNATYPIKTAQDAWNELNSNSAYIASHNPSNKEITIRRVYLAYFDPGVPTDYFQPMIVFEGDGEFVAYVPAVTPDYYGE